MAVVINDFEVVGDEGEGGGVLQRSAASTAVAHNPATTAAAPTAQDIERALEQQHERMERVRAH